MATIKTYTIETIKTNDFTQIYRITDTIKLRLAYTNNNNIHYPIVHTINNTKCYIAINQDNIKIKLTSKNNKLIAKDTIRISKYLKSNMEHTILTIKPISIKQISELIYIIKLVLLVQEDSELCILEEL